MLVGRFEGFATGLSNRMAEDSARLSLRGNENARTRFGRNALGL